MDNYLVNLPARVKIKSSYPILKCFLHCCFSDQSIGHWKKFCLKYHRLSLMSESTGFCRSSRHRRHSVDLWCFHKRRPVDEQYRCALDCLKSPFFRNKSSRSRNRRRPHARRQSGWIALKSCSLLAHAISRCSSYLACRISFRCSIWRSLQLRMARNQHRTFLNRRNFPASGTASIEIASETQLQGSCSLEPRGFHEARPFLFLYSEHRFNYLKKISICS